MSWYKHLMANVAWSNNGWTDVEPGKPDRRFRWVRENPDDHADAWLFNWADQEQYGGYVPISVPRSYTDRYNGEGMLFIASLNPSDSRYYVVGCFSKCEFDVEDGGRFTADLNTSVRFAVPLPLDKNRHCPLRKDGSQRTKTFGQNSFNYIHDNWARCILEDALRYHEFNDDVEQDWCAYSGEAAQDVIERLLASYFPSRSSGLA